MSVRARKYSDPTIYDISIDWDDAADGTEGGYDRHGNFVISSAMQEIIRLRSEVERLTKKDYKKLSNEYALLLRENEHLKDALGYYATDETDEGWVAIHALQFAGTDGYFFQESAKEKRNE